MEPEVLEQEEQSYRENPRNAFNARLKRKGEEIFKESFGKEIDFQEVKEEFNNIEALEDIAATEVKKPHFPFITFYIALVLDILDIADFTGIGWVIMSCIEIVFTIFLFILMFGKTDTMFKMKSRAAFRGRRAKGTRKRGKSLAQKGLNKFATKYLKKYMTRRLLATLIVNVIPVIGILASNAFFVVLAHNKQSKIAQKYIALVKAVTKILDKHDRTNQE
jgi:hypothetical protein